MEPDINDFKGGICIADNGSAKSDTLSVSSTREETRAAYDLTSGFYDLMAGWAEHPSITRALEAAHIMEGESVLGQGGLLKRFAARQVNLAVCVALTCHRA